MPHTGKPSGACRTCKHRHVRCDEARPSCNRCIKTNRVCPGYAEGLDLVLRNQNEVAKAGVGRREKAAQKARVAFDNSQLQKRRSLSSSRDSSPSCFLSSGDSKEVALRPLYLVPSEDEYQLCFFVDTWVLCPHDVQADRSFIELLPFMYSSAQLDSPLALCVAAISSALSTKFILKMRDVEMPKVRQKYTEALSATRKALEDPVESLTDDTLMAVCLLGFFEEAVESFRGRVSSSRHFDGAAALIMKRQGQLRTEIAQKLLLGVRNSIIYRAITFATPIDTTSSVWQDFDSLSYNPATLLDQMSLEIPNLLAAASPKHSKDQGYSNLKSLSDIPSHNQADIVIKAVAIDAKLSAWSAATPPLWAPVRLSAKDIPNSIMMMGGVYQDHCDIYPDIIVCSTWNSYRVSRVKVLTVLAELSSPSSAELVPTLEKMQELADDICASVPFSMGDRIRPSPLYSMEANYPTIAGRPLKEHHHRTAAAFGGWYLLGPMKEMMRVGRWLRPGQMAWIGTQLQRLATVYDVDPEED